MVNGTDLTLPAAPSHLPAPGVSWVVTGVQIRTDLALFTEAGVPLTQQTALARWWHCAFASLPPSLWWCTWNAPGCPSGVQGRAGGVASHSLVLCFPVLDWAFLTDIPVHWHSIGGCSLPRMAGAGVRGDKLVRPAVASPGGMRPVYTHGIVGAGATVVGAVVLAGSSGATRAS